jgi:uncharacterized 2Fe-2S/4Fe-4S cluster protein (DUF4445 family)
MREIEVPVKFQPQGKTVYVLKGTRIMEAAGRAGIILEAPCGGRGTCGKCRVRVIDGLCEPNETEISTLRAAELSAGVRLACQSSICEASAIEVPDSSLLSAFYQILSKTELGLKEEVDPSVTKKYVEMPLPTLQDDVADLERLQRATGPFKVETALLRAMPGILRRENFRGTAVFADHRLIGFESGNTESECFGAAFDVGTTTLAGVLLDLNTGREVAEASRMNPQIGFGDDVLSRILYASKSTRHLEQIHQAIIAAANEMTDEMVRAAGVKRERIYEATFAGNTAMQQILSGVDSAALGQVPFVAATSRGQLVRASDLGIKIHPEAGAYVFPVVGGFVGGDTVAGILASGLAEKEGPLLFVDIGTNGEIVLFHEGRLTAASTAAGPAFEGARISHGMRAGAGAIEKVIFDARVRFNVLGDVPPIGICGSALIDLAAELLRCGALGESGRLLPPEDLPESVPDWVRRRVFADDGKTGFTIADRGETGTGSDIVLTQRDIRELQLATGAIRAGIGIILRQAGLVAADLKRVLIAGGFGNYIRRNNAQRIGLIPAELEHERIVFVGNTSLAGAKLAQISRRARKRAEDLARRTEHVDLSSDPNFQTEFADAMIFPSD